MILDIRYDESVAYVDLGTTRKGYVATTVVDAEDVEKILAEGSWFSSWTKNSQNYYVKGHGGRVLLHRFLMGCDDHREVDHIDGNALNNRKENLRVCSHQENMMNRKAHRNNRSGARGVYYETTKGRWRYEVNYKNTRYRHWAESYEEACQKARELRTQLHGDFARHE